MIATLRNSIAEFLRRFRGEAYPTSNLQELQTRFPPQSAHVEAEWTTPEHWAHNNYERSHLPQLVIRASGWKAQLLALLFWPKPPWLYRRGPHE